jgi:hypothetical protein
VVDERNDGAGERNDEPVDADVDIDEAVWEDATELRPGVGQLLDARGRRACENVRLSMACWNILWIMSGRCLANRASMCRMDSSGISMLSSMLASATVTIYRWAWAGVLERCIPCQHCLDGPAGGGVLKSESSATRGLRKG